MESDGKGNSPGHTPKGTKMKYTLTNDQASDLLTAASIIEVLSYRGGIALTDAMREQHLEQLAEVDANIPADVGHAAWTVMVDRDREVSLSNAMSAWISEQNVTD